MSRTTRHDLLAHVTETDFVKIGEREKQGIQGAYVKKGEMLVPVTDMLVRKTEHTPNIFRRGLVSQLRHPTDGMLTGILRNLRIEFTLEHFQGLTNLQFEDRLRRYDGIFSECGDSVPSARRHMLRDYVHEGGCIFAFQAARHRQS